jgi:hypothetical protein
MEQRDREIAALQAELSQQSGEQRGRAKAESESESESASRQASEARKEIGKVRSGVEDLRVMLREVRGLAESANMTAFSSQEV